MSTKSMTLACVLAAGCATSALGQVSASQPGEVKPVKQAMDDAPLFVAAPEGLEGQSRPDHPPIDEIPAMEMPNSDLLPAVEQFVDPGQPVFFDPEMGEQIMPFGGQIVGGGGKAEKGFIPDSNVNIDETLLPESFGSMSEITSVGTNPWNMNAKLVIEYTDSNPNAGPIYRVCSGAMVDAETVMTAGHCIYKHDLDSQGNKYGWANRIWVYPGWDGNGLTLGTPQVIETHGYMQSAGLGAFTGWTQNQSFDWDIGLIRTSRAAGMLTGWFGRAWGIGCSTIQGRTYHNASFPGEGCGLPGLHNGRDMYYWSGGIDSCPGNQLEINTSPGCFSALWGGQSGSGLYYIDGGTRFIHGVASNSNRTTIGRYSKVWEDFFNYTTDFINTSRGSALDLQSLRSRYVQNSVTAGQSITGNRYYIANPTNNDPASSSYSVTHYLSTNPLISTFDTPIGTESFTYDFAPVQGVDVNNTGSSYNIPINTPSGTYYVGAYLNTSDANQSNNDASDWDAHRLVVNGVADIVAQSVSGPSQGFLGENIVVSYNFRNQGGDSSNSVTTEIRLSTNSIISTADRLVSSFVTTGLAGEQTRSGSRNVTIPTDLAPGTYYLGIISSSSDDVNSSNNSVPSIATITINARADMVATSITANSGTAFQGGTLPVSYRIDNNGLGGSGVVTVDVRASTNSFISTSDRLLASYLVGNINPGAGVTQNRNVPIPSDLAEGEYFIGMIVSPGQFENTTSNNSTFDSRRVTVAARCLPDVNNDGQVNGLDFGAWLSAFNAGQSSADQNLDGRVNGLDFGAWLSNFNAGCR